MKAFLLLALAFLLGFQIPNAQQLPLDFEGNLYPFTGFTGSSFSFRADPQQASNNVGQFFNDGSQANQGFYIDVNAAIDLNMEQELTLRFLAFDPNAHNIILKLENGNQPDVQVITQIPGNANTWQDVTFDFANATLTATGAPISATGQYTRMAIFIDFGVTTAGTYLIDQINNGSTAVPPNPIDVIYSDLVWSDEFNTTGTNNPVDPTKWFHQTQLPNGGSWFNGEQQHYTNRLENSYVENGFLNIVGKRETFTDQGVTKQFTSARLNSKFAFTYGRVDVRAKLPFGDGTWPAIWTLGKNINEDGGYWDSAYGTTNWPLCGEIDIMEHGLGAINHVSSALHTNCAGCSGNTRNVRSTVLPDVANTFHVYSMNWSPQQITFLVDDVPFYIYNPANKNVDTYPFYADQYLLLNFALGGISGNISPNFTQSTFQIDYVRVYQNTLNISSDEFLGASVYPNPSANVVHITSQETIDRTELYTLLGQKVLEQTENCNKLDLSRYENGLYVLKIYSGNLIQTEKIVVHR